MHAGGFLTGNKDDVIEHPKKREEWHPGLDRISVSLSVGVPKAAAQEQRERFDQEVIPAFKGPIAPETQQPVPSQ